MLRIFTTIFLATFVITGLVACKNKQPQKISIKIHGHNFCIPKDYLASASTGGDSFFIYAVLPDMLPPTNAQRKMSPPEMRDRQIRIYARDVNTVPIKKHREGQFRQWKPQKDKSLEYGLIPSKPSSGLPNDANEVWYHPEDVASLPVEYITCSPETDVKGYYPQCRQYFSKDGVYYKLGYDRILLPQWKELKSKTIGMTESFNCKI